jgi:hypothetical protein
MFIILLSMNYSDTSHCTAGKPNYAAGCGAFRYSARNSCVTRFDHPILEQPDTKKVSSTALAGICFGRPQVIAQSAQCEMPIG